MDELGKVEIAILGIADLSTVADKGSSEHEPIQRLVAMGYLEPHPKSPVGSSFYRITPAGRIAFKAALTRLIEAQPQWPSFDSNGDLSPAS